MNEKKKEEKKLSDLFFYFFKLKRFAVHYAHLRPRYITQLAEPDPTQVSDLKISHGKLVKKNPGAKEAQGPSCCQGPRELQLACYKWLCVTFEYRILSSIRMLSSIFAT